MKILNSSIKNLLIILCFIAAGVFAASTVITLVPANATANAYVLHPCEDDECDDSWTGENCENNEGGGTYCAMGSNGCSTSACGHADYLP